MEQTELKSAEKTMLAAAKSSQSLKTYTKAEPKPAFINTELLPYYEQTDLELMHVYECSKMLKPLKGIDVNDQQVEFWYKEFIRMGWTKHIFNQRFEAIKRATLYNRIDLENWLNAEIMYSQDDFNIAIKRKIDSLIQRGNYLKTLEVELTPEELKTVELAEMQKIKFELNNRRYELMESAAEELRKKYYETLSVKKKKIMDLTLQEKMKITDGLFETGLVQGSKGGFEYNVVLHHLEDYADLIGDSFL